MDELEMMNKTADEVEEETTETDLIEEETDEQQDSNVLTTTELVAGTVTAGILVYAGFKIGKVIIKKAIVPLTKKGVRTIKGLFRKKSNQTVVETNATVVAVEDEENSDSDKT